MPFTTLAQERRPLEAVKRTLAINFEPVVSTNTHVSIEEDSFRSPLCLALRRWPNVPLCVAAKTDWRETVPSGTLAGSSSTGGDAGTPPENAKSALHPSLFVEEHSCSVKLFTSEERNVVQQHVRKELKI